MDDKQPIKILHVMCGLKSGGVEQMLLNYYSHMDRSKFKFDIVYQHEPVEVCLKQFQNLGCNTYRIASKAHHPIKNFTDTYKIIRKNEYEIVHAHMTLMNFIPLFCAKLCGVKVRISHSHTAERSGNILKRFFYKICKVLTKLCATDFFACGEDVAVYAFGKKRKSAKETYILHNAIDIKKFNFDGNIRARERKRLGVEDKFVIGHIGRLVKDKNHSFLIDVFNTIYTDNKDAVLILVGTGELNGEIKRKIRDLGLDNAVMLLGAQADTSPIYQAFDMFLLPSISEGLGIALIEAQAAGLQCFASNAVPLETKVTDLVSYLPINKGPVIWAENIIKSRDHYSRKNSSENLKDSYYDIEISSPKLSQYYNQKMNASV